MLFKASRSGKIPTGIATGLLTKARELSVREGRGGSAKCQPNRAAWVGGLCRTGSVGLQNP
jgi:hypothetical protein